MVKLLIIVSIILNIGALALSALNHKKALSAYEQKVIEKATLKNKKLELTAHDNTISKTEEIGRTEKEKLIQTKESYRINTAKISQLETRKQELKSRRDEIEAGFQKIDKIKEELGAESADEIKQRIDSMKKQIEDYKSEIEELNTQIQAKKENFELNKTKISQQQKFISDRKIGYRVNSWEGMVTAVDDHWGFVIINAGQNLNFEPGKEFIISRNSEYIGRAVSSSVDARTTIANINYKKMAPGMRIQPGDKVMSYDLRED